MSEVVSEEEGGRSEETTVKVLRPGRSEKGRRKW